MTESEAHAAVLRQFPDGFIAALVAVKPYGWIYLCNTRAFMEGGDLEAAAIGSGPIIVLADGSEPIDLGSRLHPDEAILAFERARGFAPPFRFIRLLAWRDPRGRRPVALIKIIVSVLGGTLAHARSIEAELARTGGVSVECPDAEAAARLAEHARDLGVVVELADA